MDSLRASAPHEASKQARNQTTQQHHGPRNAAANAAARPQRSAARQAKLREILAEGEVMVLAIKHYYRLGVGLFTYKRVCLLTLPDSSQHVYLNYAHGSLGEPSIKIFQRVRHV